MSIQAIIFDNDGVLVDSEVIHVAVERELLAEFGLRYEDEVYNSRFVGLSPPDFLAALDADHRDAHNAPLPSHFLAELKRRAWPRIEADLRAMPGAAELLRKVETPYAVASSAAFERLKIKLTITDLIHFFGDHIYSSEHVARGKPAPDLFLHAASKLQIAPERCLVIEDSVHGVMAARAAGMSVIGFTGGGHSDKGMATRLRGAGAHEIAASYAELTRFWQSGFDFA